MYHFSVSSWRFFFSRGVPRGEAVWQVLSAGGPAVGIDRFRPNLHVSGCGPFEEDEMRALVLGGSVRTVWGVDGAGVDGQPTCCSRFHISRVC